MTMEFITLTLIAVVCFAIIVSAGECRVLFIPLVLLTYVLGVGSIEFGEIGLPYLIGLTRTTLLFYCLCIETWVMLALAFADREKWILAIWSLVMMTTCIIGVIVVFC